MQPTTVRVRPGAGHVLETFRLSVEEGAVQNEPVEMVPKHVVLSKATRGGNYNKNTVLLRYEASREFTRVVKSCRLFGQ